MPYQFMTHVFPVVSVRCLAQTSVSRSPHGLQRELTPNLLGQLVFP